MGGTFQPLNQLDARFHLLLYILLYPEMHTENVAWGGSKMRFSKSLGGHLTYLSY